jgi:L-ascorbate metabolism protein UlaG (beta-lactamase superfamily)
MFARVNESITWDSRSTSDDDTSDRNLPVKPVDLDHFSHPGNYQLNATWLGHSTLMINIDGYKIVTNLVFEPCVSLSGPTGLNNTQPLDICQLPAIDAVIISHDHDHNLNKDTIQRYNDKTTKFIVPQAIGGQISQWGIPPGKIVKLQWWEDYFAGDLMIVSTPTHHFPGCEVLDLDPTPWASWVIITPHHRIFISSDSNFIEGFKQIGGKYGPFDMTFIGYGANSTSWPT